MTASAPPATASAPLPSGEQRAYLASDNEEYALNDRLEAWKNGLKNGAVEYKVPTTMLAQLPSTVIVNIHGFEDKQTQAIPEATGRDTIKISSKMKVELLARDNPGEFTISQEAGDPIQVVPNDGYATWLWNVTPVNAAQGQKLLIRVSLVYDRNGVAVDQILEEKSYEVTVNVQDLRTTLRQSFWKDPIAWFKYVLPGGAGWGALAAIVSAVAGWGIWKKKKRGKKTSPSRQTP